LAKKRRLGVEAVALPIRKATASVQVLRSPSKAATQNAIDDTADEGNAITSASIIAVAVAGAVARTVAVTTIVDRSGAVSVTAAVSGTTTAAVSGNMAAAAAAGVTSHCVAGRGMPTAMSTWMTGS
jgi:hypothetical protein